jgi:hypothetical protein
MNHQTPAAMRVFGFWILRFMNEPLRERIRGRILERFRAFIASGRLFDVILGWLLRCGPDAYYIFERSSCKNDHCAGDVVRAWVTDDKTIREVSTWPQELPITIRGVWYGRMDFYIAPDGDWFVDGRREGPLSGCGGRCRVVQNGKQLEFKYEGGWKS